MVIIVSVRTNVLQSYSNLWFGIYISVKIFSLMHELKTNLTDTMNIIYYVELDTFYI
jgi:hypothetical protein